MILLLQNVRTNGVRCQLYKKSALAGADNDPGGLKNTNMYEAIFRVFREKPVEALGAFDCGAPPLVLLQFFVVRL